MLNPFSYATLLFLTYMKKCRRMDVGTDSTALPWPDLAQLQKVLLLPWLLDSHSNIFRDLMLNDKIPKSSDNTKDHHFFFSSMFATLHASASPQALEFTFTTTFFTSSYYQSNGTATKIATTSRLPFVQKHNCVAQFWLAGHIPILSCSSW